MSKNTIIFTFSDNSDAMNMTKLLTALCNQLGNNDMFEGDVMLAGGYNIAPDGEVGKLLAETLAASEARSEVMPENVVPFTGTVN